MIAAEMYVKRRQRQASGARREVAASPPAPRISAGSVTAHGDGIADEATSRKRYSGEMAPSRKRRRREVASKRGARPQAGRMAARDVARRRELVWRQT